EGRLDEAQATLRQAIGLHRDADTDSGESLSMERLAEVALADGQRWKARRLLRSAIRLADGDPLESHLVVKIYGAMVQAAGDAEEAASIAKEGERSLASSEVCDQCSMSFRVAASTAFFRAGDVARARRYLDEAARIGEMWQGGRWAVAVEDA